jgi:hypothetical protein
MVFGVGAGMGLGVGAPHPVNLDPVIPVIAQILMEVDLKNPLKVGIDCLDSSSFINVSLVSLKSIPHAMYGDNALVQEFDNGISCRLRYLESALTSMASSVHNFVFAILFSAASLGSFGQVRMVVDQMRKHWIHTALAVAASGVSIIGAVSPALGMKANVGLVFVMGAAAMQWLQTDLIGKLGSAYQRHKQEIGAALLAGVRGDNALFNQEWRPLLSHLDTHFNGQVQTLADLSTVVERAGQLMPNAVPTATPAAILGNLRIVVAGMSGSSSAGSSAISSGSSVVAAGG